VPFDLRHLRVIKYDRHRLGNTLRQRITDSLRESSQLGEMFPAVKDPDLTSKNKSDFVLADSLLLKAEDARRSGKTSDAVIFLQQGINLYRELRNYSGLAVALNNLGSVFQELCEYNSALLSLREALEVLRGVGNPRAEAATYGNLANVFETRGEYQQATEFYQRAIEVSETLGDVHAVAVHLGNLGSLMTAKGDFEGAERSYQKALEGFHQAKDLRGEATTLANLVSCPSGSCDKCW